MSNIINNIKDTIKGVFNSKVTPPDITPIEGQIGEVHEILYKEQVVSMVKNEFERRQTERLPFELQWRLNLNFLDGNQYCDINEYTKTIEDNERNFFYEEREVYNHIAPIFETRLAKLGRVQPSMKVRPATSELEDVSSAKVCTSIVMSAYSKLQMSKKITNANSWMELCGSVFYKPIWDNNSGTILGYIDGQPIAEGDLEQGVIPAFEIFPDSCFNDGPENCKSIIHAKPYSVDDIYDIWNREIPGREIDVFSISNSSLSVGGLGYNSVTQKITHSIKENCEIVIEYYEKPSRKYNQGRLIIVAGNELLYYGPLPYKIGEDGKYELPFVRQNCIDRPGCFFGTSVIERLIPIQRAYNAVKNKKHDFMNRAVIGVLSYEDGSLSSDTEEMLEQDGIAPGTIIPRKRGSAVPSFVDPGRLPTEFIQEEQSLENAFIMISGVSEISRNSNAPTGVSSGTALEVLKEQDDTRISLTAEHVRQAIVQLGKYWLRLYKQFATGPRIDRLVGTNNEVIISEWNASKITSDDVVMDTENELAQTLAQRKQNVYELIKSGLLNNPETGRIDNRIRSKLLEMMNYGNIESADDLEQLHINKAQKENMQLEKGVIPQIKDFDDHEIHLYEHDRFRLGGEYALLEKQRPDLTQLFDFHVSQHQQILQQRIMAMQQQQMLQQTQGIK